MEFRGFRHRVCKVFYLSTFDISQTPIFTAHSNIKEMTNVASCDLRVKKQFSKIFQNERDDILNHILALLPF